MIIKGCDASPCTSTDQKSIFYLGPGESVVGFCYSHSSAGTNALFLPYLNTQCPDGCDFETPNDLNGVAFTTADWSITGNCPEGCDKLTPGSTDHSLFDVLGFPPRYR